MTGQDSGAVELPEDVGDGPGRGLHEGHVEDAVAAPDDKAVGGAESQAQARIDQDALEIPQAGGIAGVPGRDHFNGKVGSDGLHRPVVGHHHSRRFEVEVVNGIAQDLAGNAVMLEADSRCDGEPGRHLPIVLEEEAELVVAGFGPGTDTVNLGREGQSQQQISKIVAGKPSVEVEDPERRRNADGAEHVRGLVAKLDSGLEEVGSPVDGNIVSPLLDLAILVVGLTGKERPDEGGGQGVEGSQMGAELPPQGAHLDVGGSHAFPEGRDRPTR